MWRNSLIYFPVALLSLAGAGKLRSAFSHHIIEHLDPIEILTNLVLPIVEIGLAFSLVFQPKRSVTPSIILFASFIGYLTGAQFSGLTNCNCFGALFTRNSAIMSLDFVAISCLMLTNWFQEEVRLRVWRIVIGGLVPFFGILGLYFTGIVLLISESFSPGPLKIWSSYPPEIGAVSDYHTEIKVTNRSRAKIEIERILASCGCTKINPSKLVLHPGETKSLSLSINLNQGYKPGQTSMLHKIVASFQDKDDNELDEVTLFLARSVRTFEVSDPASVIEWTDKVATEGVLLSVNWFVHSYTNVKAISDDPRDVISVSEGGIRILPFPPNHIYEVKPYVFSHRKNGQSFNCTRVFKFVRKPPEVDLEMLESQDGFALSAGSRELSIQSHAMSSQGNRLFEVSQSGTANAQDDALEDRKMQIADVVYITTSIEEDDFLQDIVVPILPPKPTGRGVRND